MTETALADARELASRGDIPWESYEGKTVIVTGATGLIGGALTSAMLTRAKMPGGPAKVVALVRNQEKARALFGDDEHLEVLAWSAEAPAVSEADVPSADFVFHCANVTDSEFFITHPVETIETTVGGAQAMIDLAARTSASLCVASTMETYGEVAGDGAIGEEHGGFLDAMNVRNSYPEAKRLVEAMCAAHASERGVRASVVRLVQTIGPGVAVDDRRVFAEFARCARSGRDIVLLTDGSKRNSYLYVSDAVSALITVAALGEPGRAYNAANDASFCSVREMAEMVSERFGNGACDVVIRLDPDAATRFRKGSVLRLDVSRLEALGWRALTSLETMYERLLADWAEHDA